MRLAILDASLKGDVAVSTSCFCDQCGIPTAVVASTCPACGADLPVFRVAESASFMQTAIILLRPSIKYWPFAAAAAGILLLALSYGNSSGRQPQNWGAILFLSSPLIAGWVIAFTQIAAVGIQLERFETWMARHREAAKAREGAVSRWVMLPMFWMFALISTLAARISNVHIRVGIKFAAYFYFAMIVLYLAIMATMLFLLLVGLAIAGFVISLFSSSGDTEPTRYKAERKPKSTQNPKPMMAGPKGSTLFNGTNIFNEKVAGRVDKDGKIYDGSNWLNEKLVGRIDDNGNVYEGTNIFNESKTGRIDDGGHIFQGTNIFNEERTGRIDSDGDVYKGTNIFNEEEIGRVEKKK